MKKSLVKQFEEQFGKEWTCSCSASFEPKALEIISENKNSLIAHYVCPKCQKEQMLAAAVRASEKEVEAPIHLPRGAMSADDVLDIKNEIKQMKFGAIKSLDRRGGTPRKRSVTASTLNPPENSLPTS